ncbi:MAG: CBS domain-containing protein [Acidobacteriota bacterium]
MRDREFYDEDADRWRGYGRHRQAGAREGYGLDYERERERDYDYDYGYQRYSREPYESRYEPRYEPRYSRQEYADRERMQWGYAPVRTYLRCRDVMTRDVAVCHRDSNLREVARLMRDEDTGALPVVDADNRVIGMITDRDIVVRVLADLDRPLDSVSVEDAMTNKVYSVRPNDRLIDALHKMGDKQVRRILVTDDNDVLKGIISMGDIATEAELDQELANTLEEISKPKSWFRRLFGR